VRLSFFFPSFFLFFSKKAVSWADTTAPVSAAARIPTARIQFSAAESAGKVLCVLFFFFFAYFDSFQYQTQYPPQQMQYPAPRTPPPSGPPSHTQYPPQQQQQQQQQQQPGSQSRDISKTKPSDPNGSGGRFELHLEGNLSWRIDTDSRMIGLSAKISRWRPYIEIWADDKPPESLGGNNKSGMEKFFKGVKKGISSVFGDGGPKGRLVYKSQPSDDMDNPIWSDVKLQFYKPNPRIEIWVNLVKTNRKCQVKGKAGDSRSMVQVFYSAS
jgi:hypothetical protein